ncbi:hypothetical protein CLUG_05799 [Clavispora lusitaniae ATCC 42720]|uniref:Uncharacterized protein n=1 Tax=Clavispora lusitaniae (strain ATCC 42720) TaxID=306902 RepID=C4YCG0_CLAL4|nr:uncharacterized protein CLUG_05799 [Clavispora lusitaniae ATCC 42720]EEQ41672.1 hypothetical protein CLUG_05799 [Clavispora lusitaniae ATCC 42720]
MGDTKGVEEQDIGVFNSISTVANPLSHTTSTVSRPLRNVVSGWVQSAIAQSFVLVRNNLGGPSSPWCSLSNQRSFLSHKRRSESRHQLVRGWLSRVWVDLARVEDVPASGGGSIGQRVRHGLEHSSLREERVTVHVSRQAGWTWTWLTIGHSGRVVVTVNTRVQSQREHVSVVVSVHLRVDDSSPWSNIFILVADVSVQDTSQTDLQLDGTVLSELPVDTVLVVGSSEDSRHNQLLTTSNHGGSEVISEVRVLEQQTVIFLVDANSILHRQWVTGLVGEMSIHVVDHTLTVTSKSKRVGTVSRTILTNVQSMLSLVREVRTTVRHNHLRQRDSVEERSDVTMVVVGHVRQNNTLSVVEANVEAEVGPFHNVAVHLERHTFWLGHIVRSVVSSETRWVFGSSKLLSNVLRVERRVLVLGHLSSSVWNIDVHNLTLVHVHNRAEVQWVRVLRVILVRTPVHQSSLKTSRGAPTLIVTNGPGVTVDVGHFVLGKTGNLTSSNDLRIVTDDVLGNRKVGRSQNRSHAIGLARLDNGQRRNINNTFSDTVDAILHNNVVGQSWRNRSVSFLPVVVSPLDRFSQGDGVENNLSVTIKLGNDRGHGLDFLTRKWVQRVRWRCWWCRTGSGSAGNLSQSLHM